jgi:hypothetical protein
MWYYFYVRFLLRALTLFFHSVWDGHWKLGKSGTFHTMVHQNGDPCRKVSEQPRTAKVEIACAKERLELVRVHESAECEYELLLHTPFPCPESKDEQVSQRRIF